MVFALKENEAEARERLRAFWSGSSLGRPALAVTALKPGIDRATADAPLQRSLRNDRDPAWHAAIAARRLDNTAYLAEAMPSTLLEWGNVLVTVAVLAGGAYDYESDTAWIKPLPDMWQRPLPRFDPNGEPCFAMERCLAGMAQVVGQRGLVNPPIMLDGMTTLSAFRTPRQLCYDCIERPAAVRAWSDALTSIYIEAYEHFRRYLLRWGYTDTTTWLHAMAEGTLEAVQCDFSVMLSPAMYEQFVMPDLRRLTEYFQYSLYHLDGTCQLRFLRLLGTLPRLNGIQWNPEPPAGSPVRWLSALRDIRSRGWVLHINCDTVDEAVTLTRELGPDGLLIVLPRFDSLAAAQAAIARIERAVQ